MRDDQSSEEREYYDQLVASAARFLIEGGEHDAASVLLACAIDGIEKTWSYYDGGRAYDSITVRLRGPRSDCNILNDSEHQIYQQVFNALQSALPHDQTLDPLTVRMELADLDPAWRVELTEIARGQGVHNQAAAAQNPRTWRGLRFRSMSEVRIAEALDRAGVLFFPLCLGRVTSADGRVNREPDFLVCHDGRWGILEVDGEPFHPPQRTVQDHERDRLFKSHGIRVVEHYDATRCYQRADEVVRSFLMLVAQA